VPAVRLLLTKIGVDVAEDRRQLFAGAEGSEGVARRLKIVASS
jgi:hypothetical protein